MNRGEPIPETPKVSRTKHHEKRIRVKSLEF